MPSSPRWGAPGPVLAFGVMWQLDDYPLAEEIGDPDLFVGREQEMTRLLDWAEAAKPRHSKSMGILSRRKKGKTALLQRFFNILYTSEALTFETSIEDGEIAHTWGEYLADAIDRVNDQNAHKMVLYLAKHEPEEKDREEILRDLQLDMTEKELAERLKKLVYANILAQGSSNFHYRGLGDRVFAMVFRRIYGAEIERVDVTRIDEDFKREIAALKGKLSVRKGEAAEHRVRYRLSVAAQRGATVADIVMDSADPSRAVSTTRLGPFKGIRKARLYVDQDTSREVDLHAVHEKDDGTDLMIEVKDWEKTPPEDALRRFIETKEVCQGQLERPTIFLFHSASGLGDKGMNLLGEAGILVVDAKKLAHFELF